MAEIAVSLHPTGRPTCGQCGTVHRERLDQIHAQSRCFKCKRQFRLPEGFRPLRFSAPIGIPTDWGRETDSKVLCIEQLLELLRNWLVFAEEMLLDDGKLPLEAAPYMLDILEVTDQLETCLLPQKERFHSVKVDRMRASFRETHEKLAAKLPEGWKFTPVAEVSRLMPPELVPQYLLEKYHHDVEVPKNEEQMRDLRKSKSPLARGPSR